MKPSLQRLALLLAMLGVALDAAAQPQFDRWTTANGLPQGSINDIVQTRDGYLWLATFGGLVRFDGSRFVVFDTEIPGIRSQRMRALCEDGEGTLWAATEDGMVVQYRDGRFTTYDNSDGLPHIEALRIDEDAERNLWITWGDGSMTRFDRTRFVTLRGGELARGVRPHLRFAADPQRRRYGKQDVWWNADAAGIHALVNGTIRTLSDGRAPTSGVTEIISDHDGNLLLRTSDGHLRAIPNRHTASAGAPLDGGALDLGVFLGSRLGDDFWFSAELRNLYRISGGRIEKRATLPETILSLQEDREGSLWIGTNTGLHRLRNVPVATRPEPDALSSNSLYSILRAGDGTVWAGTWGSGVNAIAGDRTRAFRHADGLPSEFITAIHEDRSRQLWVGTTAGLTYLRQGRFKEYEAGREWLGGSVWAMLEDRAGRRWFATDHGLVKLEAGAFTRYTAADGLSHDRVTTLLEDASGAIWIGAYRGLTRYQHGTFTAYVERDGFVGNQVRAIHEDAERTLWVGTYDGGLYRVKDGRLTRYTRREGLYDNGAFQILEDDRGNFWIGCNRGIYRVKRADLNAVADGASHSLISVVLGAKDGLAGVEVNGGRQPGGMKGPDGRLWFPTQSGIVVIDPHALSPNMSAPPVVIEEVRRAGQPIAAFAGGIEIPPGSDSFEFRYTAPSFVDPEQVAFKYMLAGLDRTWVDARGARVATYHRVPPGRYRFTVIAANNDGVWNTSGAGVDVVVVPPLWRTWWFVTLAAAAFATMLFAAYHQRVSRLSREQVRQRAFAQQLMDSLEHERRRISNEMHDVLGQDLTIIKTRVRLTRERLAAGDPARDELHEIGVLAEKTGAELKEIAYDLRPYHLDKVGLSATMEGMIRRVGRSCEIAFVADIGNIDSCFRPEARIHVFRIAQEAVSNIVKHSGARQARVTIQRAGGRVELRIEDDGRGLPEDHGAGGARKTFGIMGMLERARLAGGEAAIGPRAGGGTMLVARFKLEESHHDA